jgi:predicted nucleotidyltransferase
MSAVPVIEQAFIYGSWADRYLGREGKPPNDIDVLVVGDPSRRGLARVTRQLTTELGLEVEPHVVSLEAFEQATSGFLRTIKEGPLISLDIGERP